MTIEIQVLLSEEAIAREFYEAFGRRDLREKLFYWFPLSVRAWLRLCGDVAYRNFVRSKAVLDSGLPAIVEHLPEGPVTVLSLGSGQGVKDAIVLGRLREANRLPQYIPVDSSQTLLEMACGGASTAGLSCHGVKADLTNREHLDTLRPAPSEPPRLVLLLGNTLGAFDPLAFPAELEALLRPGDLLVIDGEIFREAATMAGYDNPINRDFAFGPLRAAGLVEPDDGRLVFYSDADQRMPGLYRVRKHFDVARSLRLNVAGEELVLEAGERIEMNWSYKYTIEAFDAVLARAGIATVASKLSDDGCFRLALGAVSRRKAVRRPGASSSVKEERK